MLQITNLGVCKCIWCLCVMILHTPHMYFRLQPVLSANLCSVGFANVDVFLSKSVLQHGNKLHVCAAMNTKMGANLSLQPALLLQFFSLQLDTWIKSYDVLSETPHIL